MVNKFGMILTLSGMLAVLGAAFGSEEELLKRIEALEQEVQEQKANQSGLQLSGIPSWVDKFRLSGNADFVYYKGDDNSHSPDSRFAVDSARLFFDFYVNEDVSFFLEWDIVREFTKQNDFTQLYLQVDRIFDFEALSLKIGRSLIPYGEEYTRFHHARFENPLITFSAPGAWWWDEGLLVFGSTAEQRFGYEFAVMDGDIGFNDNTAEQVQLAGKVTYRPTDWAKLSLSGLSTGKIGSSSRPGISAMFFGGQAIVPFGFRTNVPNFKDGKAIVNDLDNAFTVEAWEIDSIFSSTDWGRLWLAYGHVDINSKGDSIYDRELHYWIVEGILELGVFSSQLSKFYLATRYSGIGTFDSDEGYSLGAFNDGGELGFNTKSVDVISLGIGVRLKENIKFKLEYAWYDFSLVDGVTTDLKDSADDRNLFGVGISAEF